MLGIWLLCDNYFYCLDVKVGKQLADINARSRWIFTFFQASNEIKLKKMIPFYIIARVVPLVQMVTYMYRRKRQSFTEISNNPCSIPYPLPVSPCTFPYPKTCSLRVRYRIWRVFLYFYSQFI